MGRDSLEQVQDDVGSSQNHGPLRRPRDSPVSKNSATITPAPAASINACCNCRARDVTGSCQSSVDTRP